MLHVDVRGEGATVVVLNGYPVAVEHLRPLAERLAARRRTAVVHLPGYGKSPPLVPYDAERSYELVEDALLARGISEAAFVGYSFGVHRAIATALRGRVRARSIVGLAGVAGYEPEQAAQFIAFAEQLTDVSQLIGLLEQLMLSPRGRERPEIVAELRTWATATSIESLRAEVLGLARTSADLLPRVAELDVPMLLRVGTADAGSPPERSRQMAAVARDCRVEEVEGVGHMILSEDFEGTATSIERFLDEIEHG